MKALITVGGPLISIAADEQTPLTGSIVEKITKPLIFTKIKLNYHRGNLNKHPERCVLYHVDEQGKIWCHRGWIDKIHRMLLSEGYEVTIKEDWPPLARPDCYTEDIQALANSLQFRPKQIECIAALIARIRDRRGGVVVAPPAFGKTKLISALCVLYPKAKIDIITHGNELIEDLYRHVLKLTPDVGVIAKGSCDKRRVTIISDMSLKYSDGDADIVLADEVHKLMTDRAVRELARYDHACMFGFTATPDTRLDNAHRRMEGLFGPVIFQVDWEEAVRLGVVVPIHVYMLHIDSGVPVSKYYRSQISMKRFAYWRNTVRNRRIAEAARNFVKAGLQTLILVETVEHMVYLKELLPEFQVCYSNMNLDRPAMKFLRSRGLLENVPKLSYRDRMDVKARFENRDIMGCIATTIWTQGVSFDSLQVLIRADGGYSETNNQQWPGRVARIDPKTNKSYGILVDCFDEFDVWTKARSFARLRSYRSNGWQISHHRPSETPTF